ncbi:MAG: glycosyltransferase family 2 protein [Bacteroidales bacterium]|nr:glycosyltransferase family 2 protein [Bacteroidales bacterium]
METLILIFNILQALLLLYLGSSAVYLFILSIAGQFSIRRPKIVNEKKRRFAVLIPGYKEDAVIVHVAEDAIRQNYPQDLFDVVIIADTYQPATIEAIKKLPVKLIEVSFDKSTKAKALNKAMAQLPGNYYDIALVLDADNLMEADLLSKINDAFSRGYKVVQGHRAAKNTHNTMALLDAISEEINNHLFRKGHRVLGLSSGLIGSGMAFDYNFFKDLMLGIKAIGGFDKEIELKMTKDGVKMEYLEDAYILDEKVSDTKNFSNQRRRWLAAQAVYFTRTIGPATIALITKGNINFFLKSFQQMQPPRVLLLGISWILGLISIILIRDTFTPYWLSLLLCVSISLLISVPRKFWNKQLLAAIAGLPKIFILMALSLMKIKGANKTFIHTEHSAPPTENLKK